MIYCFDTSTINQLHDDPDREFITRGLLAANSIWITGINVAEAVATKDSERQSSLIDFERSLAQGIDPIALPAELLSVLCGYHARKAPRPKLPITTPDVLILRALSNLEALSEEQRQIVSNWSKELQGEFAEMFKEGRKAFDDLFMTKKVMRPASVIKLIRKHYAKDDDFIYEYVSEMYKRASGSDLPRDSFRQVLVDIPELQLFLLSWAQATYNHLIQQNNFSTKTNKNPGALDLWSAVYLPNCDYFITHDERQRKALKIINAMTTGRTIILSYNGFKARLLLH